MALYARHSWRFARQVTSDVFLLAWSLAWVLIGIAAHAAVATLAGPARQTAEAARRVAGDLTAAGNQAAQVPLVGDQLRRPFDSAAGSLDPLITAANGQVHDIERLAVLVGVLVAVIPVSLLVVLWLPTRVRFARASRSAQRFIDSSADLQLFALRAMATQPMHVIASISDDPVAAWRAGNPEVVTRLAEVELRRAGLTLPDRVRAETLAGR